MRHNRTKGRLVVYLDETWETQTIQFNLCSEPSDKGERLIIWQRWMVIFYGSKLQVDDFVTGCDRVFNAKKGSSADYHQEINAENFERWFQEKLLSALPANCLMWWTMPVTIA